MDLQKQFEQFINAELLFNKQQSIIIAVSGGVDSMVLAHLCKAGVLSFAIAHCNFDLRGEESKLDEALVKQLAEGYGVPFFGKLFNTNEYAMHQKLSIQEAARELRYTWFNELLSENSTGKSFDYIATAHHADDNAETILMNFFKGTGINGLKGIFPKNQKIIRPLLFARKADLLVFADEHKLAFREDSSNSSDKYTRNFYRNKIIPQLKEQVPGVIEHIIAQAPRFRDIKTIYDLYFQQVFKKLIEPKNNSFHIPVLKLQQSPAMNAVLYELAIRFDFTPNQVPEIEKLLNASSGKYITSATHRILRDRNWLIISKTGEVQQELIIIEKDDKEIRIDRGLIKFKRIKKPDQIDTSASVAQLDMRSISYPLFLRKWKQGDYFYPLGMKKKKKLSRFFIDRKMSLADKENTWVIESQQKILWIVGLRIDDRFKITNGTTDVLQVTLVPEN